MKTLGELRRQINSVEDLQSVVATMKTLAAARIRQFETAAEATRSYFDTVQQALQVLLLNRKILPATVAEPGQSGQIGCVLLGSDQGFCGRFNEVVTQTAIRFVDQELRTLSTSQAPLILTVGARLNRLMLDAGWEVEQSVHVPKSVSDITTVIQDVTTHIDRWRNQFDIQRIELIYNRRSSAATYDAKMVQLMPLAKEFLDQLQQERWQSRGLPIYQLPWQELFTSVVRQYLFISLFRACAESLASENASRIAAMQQAERNIDERLQDLNSQFNQNRQQSVTEELLDIVSGFEAVTG